MELWCEIKEYPNYEASSEGRIRNKQTGKILSPGLNTNGYKIVVLSDGGITHTKTVHRLVADSFYDGDHTGFVVDHIDGNKQNNFVGNLQFCTSSENNARAYKTGLKKPTKAYNQPSNRGVRIIETGEEFRSIKECARAIGGNHRHISDCLNGKLNKHHGFHYEEIQ